MIHINQAMIYINPMGNHELLPIIASMLPQESNPTMFLKTFNETVRSLRVIDEEPRARVQEDPQTEAGNRERTHKRPIKKK